METTPFLSPGADTRKRCLLCNENIKDKEDISNVTEIGLKSLQTLAKRWEKLDRSSCTLPPYGEFQLAMPRLSSHHKDMIVHKRCQITFRNRVKRKETQSSQLEPSSSEYVSESSESDNKPCRFPRKSLQKKHICFICKLETSDDSKQYNNGGLGRCSEENAFIKIKSQMDLKINDKEDKYHAAAMRLNLLLSGTSYDAFAIDLFYHRTCYMNFTYAYDTKKPTQQDIRKSEVLDKFFRLFEHKVIKDQEAYILTELLEDLKEMSEDHDLINPPISKTFNLKQKLIEKFGESIDFHVVERRLIVHPSGVNPVLYSAATLKGYGLQENDLTKAFSRLIRRKISQREPIAFPPEAQDLIDLLDTYKPLSCIYNAISWSINPKRSKK